MFFLSYLNKVTQIDFICAYFITITLKYEQEHTSSSDFNFALVLDESPPRNRFNDLSTIGGVEVELGLLLEPKSGVL